MSHNTTHPLLNELHSMKRKMDALYLESFTVADDECSTEPKDAVTWQPSMDIWQTDGQWILVADLPGVSDADLQVQVIDNKLTVQGRRDAVPGRDGAEPYLTERPSGFFSRTFMLTQDIDKDSISAEFKRGILTVVIPKAPSQGNSPHKISVQSA